MNNNLKIEGIFCDLQKAFDCVNNHKILLDKLEFYGIQGKFKTLIESYLTGRYKKVTIIILILIALRNGKWSIMVYLKVQFLIPCFSSFYINDLPKIITKNNGLVLFTDDTSLLITDSNNLDFNININ